MNSQQLLYSLIFICLLVALYFIFKRSKGKQTEQIKQEASVPVEGVVRPVAVEEAPPATVIPLPKVAPAVPSAKIYFAFNGHDWEAHEALGVPVNAPLSTVTKMYQHLIKTSDASTFDFYESAYNALVKKRKESKR